MTFFLHSPFHFCIALFRIGLAQSIEHFDDQLPDFLELCNAKSTGGAGRGPEPDTRGDHRLFRIKRDAVLITRDISAAQGLLGGITFHAFRRKIDQREMRVRAAGDNGVACLNKSARHGAAIINNSLAVGFEFRFERVAKSHRFTRDDVHQWAALSAREDGGVEFLLQVSIGTGKDNAATRAAQSFVSS